MKNTPLLALGLMLCTPLGLFAQTNFSGSDDFSNAATSASYWTDAGSEGTGTFDISGGVVNFTDEGLTVGGTNSASVLWNQNSGSYTANWAVQSDCTISSTMGSGETAYWALALGSSVDDTDFFTITLQTDENNSPFVQGILYTDDSYAGASSTAAISGDTATLQVYYTATTHTLTAAYDANGSTDGYSFTDLWSAVVPSAWGMTSSDVFALVFEASHSSTSSANSITTGSFTADNFSAVPEPSTYALLGGLAALGVCFWRRRAA